MCYSSTLDMVSKAVLVMHTAVSSTLSAQLHGLYIGSICIDNLVASLFIYLFIVCSTQKMATECVKMVLRSVHTSYVYITGFSFQENAAA